ncbi:MAG: flavin monoamine oxidase family protein, partial [bacterium]
MAWTQCVSPQWETPEKWLLYGGAGQIPAILADQIKKESMGKSCIHTNAGVKKIVQLEGGGVSIDVKGIKNPVQARAVIVAIPPSLRKCITFESRIPDIGMPPDYLKFSEESPMGSMSKLHVVYEKAFWRDQCLSGSTLGNLETCQFFVDCSPPSGEPGILTSFIAADRNTAIADAFCLASFHNDEKARDEAMKKCVWEKVKDDLVSYFGFMGSEFTNRLEHPVEFVYYNWNLMPWTGGAFTTHLGPNVWTGSAKTGWREPFHDIFWAGTETADRWPGFFDGAISAGNAAASRVSSMLYWTEALKPRPKPCLKAVSPSTYVRQWDDAGTGGDPD